MYCYPCHLIDVNRLFSEKKRSFYILWFLRNFIGRMRPKILLDVHLSDGIGTQLRYRITKIARISRVPCTCFLAGDEKAYFELQRRKRMIVKSAAFTERNAIAWLVRNLSKLCSLRKAASSGSRNCG